MKLISWNVNGVRAVHRKELLFPFLEEEDPDILCLQETKAHFEQLPKELQEMKGYHLFYSKPEKKGYSGVATFTKKKPLSVSFDIGAPRFNKEGRTVCTEFKNFTLFNVYFPNGASGDERLKYKMNFYRNFLKVTKKLKDEGKKIIVCGDVNTAHQVIDLFEPDESEDVSGFLPIERQWLDDYFATGFLDTFRLHHPDKADQYTWWDYRTGARERNDGWRIDYFIVSDNLKKKVKDAFILPEVFGSDHCPIGIELS